MPEKIQSILATTTRIAVATPLREIKLETQDSTEHHDSPKQPYPRRKCLERYRDRLGLKLIAEDSPLALVFDGNRVTLRATYVAEFKPQPFTILGWQVSNIEAAVQQLQAAQIGFKRYPWMQSDGPLPIWKAPSGAQISWFDDPFGNVLSLTQYD